MKVLFVAGHPKYLVGGAEVQSYRIAMKLKEMGHEVAFFSPSTSVKNSEIDENGITINFCKKYKGFRIFEIFHTLKELKKYEADLYYMRGSKFISSFVVYYKRHNKISAKTIFQNAMGAELTRLFYTKNLLQSKNIIKIAKNIFDEFTYDLATLYTIKNCDYIISQTAENTKIFLEKFNRKSVIITKGIEMPKENCVKSVDKIKVYFVRNIKPVSRIDRFIEVAKIVQKTNMEIEFHVIGNILLKNKEEVILEMKNAGINYHGKLDNSIVLTHLNEANILIDSLEEINSFTTLSTTFLEAWARKVVVISFETNPEEILTGNGIGYKVESINEAADKIIYLTQNKEELLMVGEKAFNYVKSNNSLDSEVKNILNIIKD